ncbi:MAG: thiamine-phosphate kinase [Acidobacteriia bacterium]|nr:thiamine-phosphate kinase [Terriglobia bacterium]
MPLHEKALIQRIRRQAPGGSSVVKGIGDDCAVLRVPPGHELLVTTDFTIEKVHFRRDWHRPDAVGRRCLARGLSDIAAMGGQARAAFLSLALASDVPQKWVDRFMTGLLSLADEFHVPLAGGDTAQSPVGIQADIVVVGSVPRGKSVLRSGARPGDQIYVSGELGGAAAALARLAAEQSMGREASALLRPHPRLAVGEWLRRRGLASAMIDLSDGLSTDLAHICEESHVGAEIDAEAIPLARVGQQKKLVALDLALHGGEDYELLFTSSQNVPARVAGVRVTRIGRITQASGMRLLDPNGRMRELQPQGWEHFRATF